MRVRQTVVVLGGVFSLGWSAAASARQAPTFTKDVVPILGSLFAYEKVTIVVTKPVDGDVVPPPAAPRG